MLMVTEGDLNYQRVEEQICDWLRQKVEQAGARGGVIGLSGGLDSSVTAVLARKAFGENVKGLILPCFSSEKDLKDAKMVADKFSLDYEIKYLDSLLKEFLQIMGEKPEKVLKKDLSVANVKPRLRMTVLYYYAARLNYLVIGTDNWSELKVGYFTKYGDGGVDLAPLGRMVKTEVRQLARHLEIPETIINKAPSAGLWEGQADEKELGISYEELDRFILTGQASSQVKKTVQNLEKKNRHKLKPPPFPERDYLLS